MSELVFLLSADLDIQRAYDFYEEFQEGRGAVFMRRLDTSFGQLRRFPESGRRIYRHYYRLLVPRFPYGIYYTIEKRGVIIKGVIGTQQDPEMIRRRLG